jgi:hypothetical protein
MRYINIFMEIHQKMSSHNGHDYYGQSNYDQELEFDRHRMLYDSNLERDEYPQQYSRDL